MPGRQSIQEYDFTKPKLTVQELAKLLRLSPSKVYKLVENGEIPHYKLGSAIRFCSQEIADWLDSHHVPVEIASSPQDLKH